MPIQCGAHLQPLPPHLRIHLLVCRSRKSQLAERQAAKEAQRAADMAGALAMSQGLAEIKVRTPDAIASSLSHKLMAVVTTRED